MKKRKQTADAMERMAAAIEKAIGEAPIEDVLTIVTGTFVSLTIALMRHYGHDPNLPILIDGGPKNRDITIHPPKN